MQEKYFPRTSIMLTYNINPLYREKYIQEVTRHHSENFDKVSVTTKLNDLKLGEPVINFAI